MLSKGFYVFVFLSKQDLTTFFSFDTVGGYLPGVSAVPPLDLTPKDQNPVGAPAPLLNHMVNWQVYKYWSFNTEFMPSQKPASSQYTSVPL